MCCQRWGQLSSNYLYCRGKEVGIIVVKFSITTHGCIADTYCIIEPTCGLRLYECDRIICDRICENPTQSCKPKFTVQSIDNYYYYYRYLRIIEKIP